VGDSPRDGKFRGKEEAFVIYTKKLASVLNVKRGKMKPLLEGGVRRP
jgi:hypothetical protein